MSEQNLDKRKILSTYCTYRALFDEKKDLYDVVAEFIKWSIYAKNISNYTLSELSDFIKQEFGVTFPRAVLNTASKRLRPFIQRKNGQYYIHREKIEKGFLFDNIYDNSVEKVQSIIDELDQFVQSQHKEILSTYSLANINQYFFDYLLDKNIDNKIAAIISEFIVKNEQNKVFIKNLDEIRSGHILYLGLQNNNNLAFSSWRTELTIFLDMDILFDIAGYNGKIYQQLANEFLDLVRDTNRQKIYVHLKLFRETKNNIADFFSTAKKMFESRIIIRPGTAMEEILKDCKNGSSIIDRKSDFKGLLKQHAIELEDPVDYNLTDFYQYNLESPELVKQYSDTDTEQKQTEYRLKLINKINKLRRGKKCKNYEECKYILISRTNQTLEMSNDLAKENNISYIPCAIHISKMTNVLWFRLNGILPNSYPLTVDTNIKAQVVLQSLIDQKVSDRYKSAEEDLKSGKTTSEQYIDRIIGLKAEIKRPENINKENVDDIYKFITEDQINRRMEEVSALRNENKQLRVIVEKRKKIDEKNQHLKNLEKEKKQLMIKKEDYECYRKTKKCVINLSTIIGIGTALVFLWKLKIGGWIELDKYLSVGKFIVTILFFVLGIHTKEKLDTSDLIHKLIAFIVKYIRKHSIDNNLNIEQVEIELEEVDKRIKKIQKELQELENQDL